MADKGSIEALDAELACRTEEEGRVGPALVELDGHRGRVLLVTGTLGRAEEPPLLELDRRLRRLLWTRPCGLTAATRALADYQRLVVAPAGSA